MSAILFWLAVVAGLSLLFHHFSLSNRVVVPVGGRRTHALLAAMTALLCSALICWKYTTCTLSMSPLFVFSSSPVSRCLLRCCTA